MATYHVDEVDGRLLNIMQDDFPLVERPFAQMGEAIGISEQDAIDRTTALRKGQIIRQISAIFDTRSLGYKSSLVAFNVAPDKLTEAVRAINQHPGVSHNYERNHEYNVWFTIAVPPEGDTETDVSLLAAETGAKYRMLPTLTLYKIGVKLDMTGTMDAAATSDDKGFRSPVTEEAVALTTSERAFVREMQQHIEYVPEPFAGPAAAAGVSQAELFAMAADMTERKMLRRFAAILRHQKAGYRVNGMGVWAVDPAKADAAGDVMSEFRNISHCYLRPTYPDWPYNVFSMIHGKSKEDCEAVAKAVQERTGIEEYTMLYSTREFKKTRVEYFTDDYDRWVSKHRPGSADAAAS
ncbi:Lrp/AsnC family transcriptional regulator [Candidatus Poribacteria bacterium]|jgi:siroheme decarboxylase|nr:Lrp/AsnC family transcriptional regulator [Candidatus Poribacteria bacterium]MBT5531514.1 Lrp/AsnC family transcriptional regulator [Candidatus Poribacteria bacterium]MBT5712279.1 Lrp/AsnC family transcriptional regulator [Candidatus Poribacteria bacterium]MBT7101137.1 Lrp/AsnC family transcriptional regulator [Candidatus Poribacteria bacterium]MBT7807925.1 Lrp/AsnC family transcriptional regulator [Candidatus Poribacteria bacterium]